MQTLCSKLENSSVFSVHAGHNVGKIKGWLVDLKELKIVLMIVETRSNQSLYLLASDIRSLGATGKTLVIIDSEDDLTAKEDLLRHQQIIQNGQSLIGWKVKTQSGKTLGKIKDLSIDMNTLYVIKLHVRARLVQRLINERMLVDRSDIVGVDKNTIIVRDNFSENRQTAKKPLPA